MHTLLVVTARVFLVAGEVIRADKVIVTTGTFLRGRIHLGKKNFAAGR